MSVRITLLEVNMIGLKMTRKNDKTASAPAVVNGSAPSSYKKFIDYFVPSNEDNSNHIPHSDDISAEMFRAKPLLADQENASTSTLSVGPTHVVSKMAGIAFGLFTPPTKPKNCERRAVLHQRATKHSFQVAGVNSALDIQGIPLESEELFAFSNQLDGDRSNPLGTISLESIVHEGEIIKAITASEQKVITEHKEQQQFGIFDPDLTKKQEEYLATAKAGKFMHGILRTAKHTVNPTINLAQALGGDFDTGCLADVLFLNVETKVKQKYYSGEIGFFPKQDALKENEESVLDTTKSLSH